MIPRQAASSIVEAKTRVGTMPVLKEYQLKLPLFFEGEITPSNSHHETPKRTTNGSVTSQLLESSIRSRILTWFIIKPAEKFSIGQLQDILGTDLATCNREVENLKDIGILQSEQTENESRNALNTDYASLGELTEIVLKTDRFIVELKDVLGRHEDINLAFAYGSFTTEAKPGKTEIDLLIAGIPDVDLHALQEAMPAFGNSTRKILDITYLSIEEYMKRRRTKERSLFLILRQPRTWLAGDESEL